MWNITLIFLTVVWQQPIRFAISSIDMSVDESKDAILPISAADSAHPLCDTTVLLMLFSRDEVGADTSKMYQSSSRNTIDPKFGTISGTLTQRHAPKSATAIASDKTGFRPLELRLKGMT